MTNAPELDWTPFQRGDDPAMPFGRAELLYALLCRIDEHGRPAATAVQTAAKLGFAEHEINDLVRLFGGSSLYAQGLLVTDDGETFLPVREAALISQAAAGLDAWITLGHASRPDAAGAPTADGRPADAADANADAFLGLAVDDALLLVTNDALGSFVVTMVPGGARLLDVVDELLAGWLAGTQPGGAPAFLNVERPGRPSSTMFVRRHPTVADAFEVAVGEGTRHTPPIVPGAQGRDALRRTLAELLGGLTLPR